jgi:hypothetical protein
MSAMFNVEWDGPAMALLQRLTTHVNQELDNLMYNLAHAYGDEGVKFIKPEVRGNGKWQPSTGATEKGIGYEVNFEGDDITVNFVGEHMTDDGRLNVAHMLDVGNFDPNTELWASGPGNGLGFKAFPISGRIGDVTQFFSVIHGAGHSSPEYPKQFSDRAVVDLANRTPNIAERHLQEFLDRLVV